MKILNCISIIIPVYNSEKFIEKCISSVREQTYKRLDIIIVDDGSTDNTYNICDKIKKKDSRIKLIRQENQGVSVARNTGLSVADGDYIGFVDSDDFIDSNMYELLVKSAEEHNADIVECGYAKILENGTIIKKSEFNNEKTIGNQNILFNYYKKHNTTNYNCNKLFKKELFCELRYPNYKFSEDYYINVMTSLESNIKVTISQIGYFYLQHSGGATKQGFTEKRLDILKSALGIIENLENYNMPSIMALAVEYLLLQTRAIIIKLSNNYLSQDIKVDSVRSKLIKMYREYYDKNFTLISSNSISLNNKITFLLFRLFPELYVKIYNFIKKDAMVENENFE